MNFATIAFGAGALLMGSSLATGGESGKGKDTLADLDLEVSEAKLTLGGVSAENQMLRQELSLARDSIKSLGESLAISNSEAEVFRRECRELKLRMEALGIGAAGKDRTRLEETVLKAANDFRLLQNERDKLADQLVRLTEAIFTFLKSAVSTDAEARLAVETQMRGVNEALGVAATDGAEAAPVAATLTDGMVISVKDEYSLVVANLGTRQGVKIGMPFQVWRGDARVGLVRVVDVREKIAGAVVQDLNPKEKIKLGDRLKVDAQP